MRRIGSESIEIVFNLEEHYSIVLNSPRITFNFYSQTLKNQVNGELPTLIKYAYVDASSEDSAVIYVAELLGRNDCATKDRNLSWLFDWYLGSS